MRMQPAKIRAFTILAGFVLQAYSQVANNVRPWYDPQFQVTINVATATAEDYIKALQRINFYLVTGCTDRAYAHCVLPPQTTGRRPRRWVLLHLEGTAPEDRVTLAIRGDNLYTSAFTNVSNQWHVASNRANANLITGAFTLRFEDGYRDLLGGYRNIKDLRLSRESVLQAIRFLAQYQLPPYNTIDEGHIKRSFALLVVVFVEALRFTDVADTISRGWEYGVNLSDKQCDYIVKWQEMSCAIILSVENNGQWGTTGSDADEAFILKTQADVKTLEEAEDIIGLIVRPFSCSAPFRWIRRS